MTPITEKEKPMTPTEDLRHEHDVILLVLQGAERQAALRAPKQDNLNEIVDFLVNFVDRCHHAKEERYLFPKMEERGVQHQGGPIGAMLSEHSAGRALVAAMKEKLTGWHLAQGLDDIKVDLLEYVQLLRLHIDKENNVLFPMADKILTVEDQQSLSEAFTKLESEEIGEGVHEKYHNMAHRLAGG
jgi:hemerythrin-like domain-containing protein